MITVPGFFSRTLSRIKKEGVDFPSLTLSYVAASLKKQGHDVAYGRNVEPPADTETVLLLSSIVEHSTELAWGRRLKAKGFHVGFIGAFAGVMKEEYLKAGDFVVEGEAEFFFLNPLKKEKLYGTVTAEAPSLSLNDLPFPDWSIFPKSGRKYKLYGTGGVFFPVLASRGCPFPCRHYCTYPVEQGNVVRFRSPQNIADEIDSLVKKYNAQTILFRDPVFGINRQKTLELARELIRRRTKVKFVIETHLNMLDEELVGLLYEAGLMTVKVGIESSDPEKLKRYHRKDIERGSEARMIRKLESLGVGVICFYILALPSDTWDSCMATIKHACSLNTVGAQFSVCTPYPGTPFYEEVKGRIAAKGFDDFTQFNLVYKHENLSRQDVERLKNIAYGTYYGRLSWILRYAIYKIENRFRR